MKKLKQFNGTWLGKKAVLDTILETNNRLGKRIVSMFWVDENVVEINVIKGDGRGLVNFEEFESLKLIGDEIESKDEVINVLIQKHFAA